MHLSNIFIMFAIVNYFKMPEEILSAIKWADLINSIDAGSLAKFPVKHKSTIRSTISGAVLKEHPDRDYKTWIDEEVITVYRNK